MATKIKQEQTREDFTVVLVKPDGVKKRIVGDILSRFERVGLKVLAAKLIWVDKTHVSKHYRDDEDYNKGVGNKMLENYAKYGLDVNEYVGTLDPLQIGLKMREWNMEFLSSGPVFAMLLEGHGAVPLVRKMIGSLFPADSLPGTVRGDYALDSMFSANKEKRPSHNIVHASGSKEEAENERQLWFKEDEIYYY